MATRGNQQALLVDEFNFSCATAEVTTQFTVNEYETPNLCMTGNEYIPGDSRAEITANGYIIGVDADGNEAETYARLGVDGTVVAHLLNRTEPGTPAYVIENAFAGENTWGAPVANVLALNGKWSSGVGGTRRSYLVVYDVEITATGNQAAVDFGSAGSAGGSAFLFVHEIDGNKSGTASGASFKVQSSADNVTFADEATISVNSTDAYAASLTGTVNRYIRLNISSLGGATSFRVSLVASVNNVTH